MNGFLYEFVGLVLQASQAYNLPVPGGRKYNVPSEKITIEVITATFYPNYTQAAIAGADDFSDDNATIKDVFDIIVETTREVTPTCKHLLFAHLRSSRFTHPS